MFWTDIQNSNVFRVKKETIRTLRTIYRKTEFLGVPIRHKWRVKKYIYIYLYWVLHFIGNAQSVFCLENPQQLFWDIKPGVLLRKTEKGLEQDLIFTFKFPQQTRILVRIDAATHSEKVNFEYSGGEWKKAIFIPKVVAPETLRVSIQTDRFQDTRLLTVSPVKPFDIYLNMHTHTDLGYTQPQVELVDLHMDFIDRVVRYVKETQNRPAEEQFRWTCETTWAVWNYLHNRPKQAVQEFIDLIKRGNIEITALHHNQTALLNYEEMIRLVQDAKQIERQFGVPVRSAQNSDVNGISWGFASLLAQSGVKYLCMAVNDGWQGQAPFPEKRPNGFFWQGPDGRRILAWNGEIYHKGNFLGLLPYSESAWLEVSQHYGQLLSNGYPHDFILLPIQGIAGDNRPPNMAICDVVRDWNHTFESPRLRTAVLSDFFKRLEKESEHLPIVNGDWPDWWANGPICTAPETGLSRQASRLLNALGTLAVMGGNPEDVVSRLQSCYRDNILFKEHTWGGHSNSTEHWQPYNLIIWNWKADHVYRAWHGALKACQNLLENYACGKDGEILAFNQHAESFEGQVPVIVYRRGRNLLRGDYSIRDENGHPVAYEWVPGQDWAFLNLELSIDPFSMRRFTAVPDRGSKPIRSNIQTTDSSLKSPYYTLSWDKGGICSVVDLQSNRELIDRTSPFRLGSLVLEQPKPGKAAEERSFLGTFGQPVDFIRESMQVDSIRVQKPGGFSRTVRIHGTLTGHGKIATDIKLFDHRARMDVVVTFYRAVHYSPHAYYVAFPFAIQNPDFYLDLAGAVGRPWMKQLPGSCQDWFSIQDWVAVGNQEGGVLWVSDEAPVVQLGGIRTGDWNHAGYPKNGTIVSWPLQEYTTACQEPFQQFHYSIISYKGKFSPKEAIAFARNTANPPIAFYYPDAKKGKQDLATRLRIEKLPLNVHVESVAPAVGEKAFLVRLREVEGKSTSMQLSIPNAAHLVLTDPFGKRIVAIDRDSRGLYAIPIKAYECICLQMEDIL